MAVSVSETWTGSNGAAWPSQWTTYFGTATIQANAGQIVNPAGGTYSGSYASLTGMADQTDTELLMTFSAASTAVEQYLYLALNVNRSTAVVNGTSPDGYYLQINYSPTAASSTIQLFNFTTQLGGAISKTLAGATSYNLRFQRTGSTLRARIWAAGASEPATWDITYTGALTRTGIVQLVSSNGANTTSRTFTYDNVTVYGKTTTLAYEETWDTNTANTAWPGQWTLRNGTFTVQSNAGSATAPAGGFNSARADISDVTTIYNFDYTVTVTGATNSVEQFFTISVGDGSNDNHVVGTGPYVTSGNAYGLEVNYNATAASGTVAFEIVNDGFLKNSSPVTVTLVGTTPYRTRFRRVGSVLFGKVWPAASAEPVAWTTTYTLTESDISAVPKINTVSVGAQNGGDGTARTFTFDNLNFDVYQGAETWTGTDGAAWPAQWNTHTAATTIQSNAGSIAANGSAALQAGYASLPAINLGDTDVTVSIKMAAAAVDQSASLSIDGDGSNLGQAFDANCYVLNLNYAATAASSFLSLFRRTNGTGTQLGTNVVKTLTGTTSYRARFRRIGQVLSAKVWDASVAEPVAWDITYTLLESPLTGQPSLGVANGSAAVARTAQFDDLTVLGTPFIGPPFVQQNTASVDFATSLAVTLPSVVAGHGLIATVQNYPGNKISSITDSAGGVWARASGLANGNPGNQEIWYCSRHPGSVSTLTVTVTLPAAAAISLNLSDWVVPLYYATGVFAEGGNGNAKVLTVPTIPGQLVIGLVGLQDNTLAPVSTGTALTGVNSSDGSNSTGFSVATVANTSIAWAGNSVVWAAAATVFNTVAPVGVKAYSGSAFAVKPVKVWSGTSWAVKPVKRWSGTSWSGTTAIFTPKITRSGSNLQINGVTRRFGGANAYWLGLDDNNGGTYGTFPTRKQISAAVTSMQEMGVNLVRAHTVGMSAGTPNSFETAPGVYNNANMDSADWAVYEAKRAGMYLMVPLTDNWNFYHGGKWNFVHWAYQQNPSGITDTPGTIKDDTNERIFFANTAPGLRVRALFKDYINNWLNHYNPYTGLKYKDDPTIAIVETGNEIYYASQIGSNEWTQDICAYVKSIAPDKLLADGSAATNVAVSAMPGLTAAGCDIVGSHYYAASPDYSQAVGFTKTPTMYGTNTTALQVLAADVTSAVTNSKAYILGEYPWTRSDMSSWYSSIESNASIAGSMYWAFIGNTDAGVAETHGAAFGSDDYPVHRPYVGTFEPVYAPQLVRHTRALSGVPYSNGAGSALAAPNLIASISLQAAADATLFTIGSGTITDDFSIYMESGSSVKVTPTGSGVYPYWYFTTPANGAPVSPGSQYTAVASVRAATSASQSFQTVLVWYKSDGSYISSSPGSALASIQNVWIQSTATATAPALSAYAVVQVQAATAMSAANVINIDQYGIFPGTSTAWA